MLERLQRLGALLLDLLFPPTCVACQAVGTPLCPACLKQWQRFAEPRCPRCDEPLTRRHRCSLPPTLDRLLVLGPHRGVARHAVHALKYRRQRDVAVPLGRLMAAHAAASKVALDVVAPVPLHPRRLATRGYNQAALLAQVVAEELKIPCADVLQRIRETPPQVGLSRRERLHNVADAFALVDGGQPHIDGRHVLLVDDVCTTGATMGACATVLRHYGATSVVGLTVSRSIPSVVT